MLFRHKDHVVEPLRTDMDYKDCFLFEQNNI